MRDRITDRLYTLWKHASSALHAAPTSTLGAVHGSAAVDSGDAMASRFMGVPCFRNAVADSARSSGDNGGGGAVAPPVNTTGAPAAAVDDDDGADADMDDKACAKEPAWL